MDTPDEEKRQQDIEDVIREATSRRPLDVEALREEQRVRNDYRWLIRNADEATFKKGLSDLGWTPGSIEFEQHVRAWRALRRPFGGTPPGEPSSPPEASSPSGPSS